MSRVVRCRQCETQLALPDEAAEGRSVSCPVCGGVFGVPPERVEQLPVAVPVDDGSETIEQELAELPAGVEAEPANAFQPLAGVKFEFEPPEESSTSALTLQDFDPPKLDPQYENLLDRLRAGVEGAATEDTHRAAADDTIDGGPTTPTGATEPTPESEPAADIADVSRPNGTHAEDADPIASDTAATIDFTAGGLPDVSELLRESLESAPDDSGEYDSYGADEPANETSAEPYLEPVATAVIDRVVDRVDSRDWRLHASLAQSMREQGRGGGVLGLFGKSVAWASAAAVGLCLMYGLLIMVGGPGYDTLGVLAYLPQDLAAVEAIDAGEAEEAAPPFPSPPENDSNAPEAHLATYEAAAGEPGLSPSDAAIDSPPAPFEEPPAGARPLASAADASSASGREPLLDDEAPIVNAPEYRLEQLDAALAEAEEAFDLLANKNLTDSSDRAALGRSYARLCEVAHLLTFLADDSAQPQLAERRLEVERRFAELFRRGQSRDDSRELARRWLAWEGRSHGGVFFAGPVGAARRVGSVIEYRMPLADDNDDDNNNVEVAVISSAPFPPPPPVGEDAVAIVGCVIDAPTERVLGYEGSADQVVWVTHVAALGDAEAE